MSRPEAETTAKAPEREPDLAKIGEAFAAVCDAVKNLTETERRRVLRGVALIHGDV